MIWLTICKTKEAVLQRRGNFMTEAKTNSKSKSNVLSLVYMAMFVAIITVCAQIQIPMTVPFTLQTLGIFMAAAMLGWKRGLISVAVYVLLGATIETASTQSFLPRKSVISPTISAVKRKPMI